MLDLIDAADPLGHRKGERSSTRNEKLARFLVQAGARHVAKN